MSNDVSLLRDAMEHAVDDLPPLPDLTAAAAASGRRRRTRARLTVVASALGVAGLAALGAVALPGGGPQAGVAATGTGPPAPYRTPVHVEATSGEPEEGSLNGLSGAERKRFEEFQQWTAAVLDGALPDAVGTIRPLDSSVVAYQGEKDGNLFRVTFAVRPDDGVAEGPCTSIPEKAMTCGTVELEAGTEVRIRVGASGSMETNATSMAFTYKGSDVRLEIAPDERTGRSAPVTAQQLLDGVRESGLLDVVRYADEHPLLEKQVSVRGG
ncbi:hypothetical protein OG257_16465 [Streptomyces sp. NBC_00683]|uniref:hypothetical protein n=1 Tax=Streptomyces sp. NBC_00683 TaxID=2903670 RepID=UPI002E32BDE4|nr:hypothetical protein [Streptomyces sp. NBC_00683]